MGTRVIYPAEIKMKAIELVLPGIYLKQVMNELSIRQITINDLDDMVQTRGDASISSTCR